MGQHTTDAVYDKLTDVEQKIDENSKSSVTTGHFDQKIADLKTAIQNGGKKEDEPQTWQDILKDMSPVKEFLAVLKGEDLFAKIILSVTAFIAAVGIVAGIVAKIKELTLSYTGRTRQAGLFGAVIPEDERIRMSFGRAENGKWGLQPEQQTDAQSPRLPSVEQINAVKEAMGHLNTEVGTYRDKVRGLATPSAMRKMASAAKKLESAAKQHQSVDTLATSVRNLNTELRALAGTAN
ncbi:hypothetical protein OG223_31455 [Streptomyces sp. NBC_01478]|jgi:methyl-accepting chemotaxis protein|uniref:hypothetical protein n=1 Tax=Streptomyces sp. NBC_01478 TaxID=2903882 RepID=UPI002E30DF09|nr:hypothetical protein [Streptomyces sp. NBC_01478]